MAPPSQAFLDGAHDIYQPARYNIIAGLTKGCGSVLDVGCGDGLLRRFTACATYLGVDVDAVAVEKAQAAHADSFGEFACADATRWKPERQFDAVVLNEVLYYIDDQPAFLARYSKMVAPGGVMIVSIYDKPAAFWQANPNRRALNNALAFAGSRLQCRIDIDENGKHRTLLVIGH